MAQKRQSEEGKPRSDGNISPEEKRRKFNLKSVVQEVIKMQSVQHLLEPILEPLIRRVVCVFLYLLYCRMFYITCS
ncbi:hypothetical protein OIU77_007746 [Salix suchowensis]|uniref:Uncharacterized protein n=1 Tax=Salix suchowensis TaxID=1278906 RepID=A0ABQ9AI70_9ROSI|nr:hypothetical protein OIU77_007746 [Salix suchowensis]